MLSGSFRFDRDEHVYTVGATPVPSISAIVRWAQDDNESYWKKPEYLERGRCVHAATLLLDLGADDADSLSKRLKESHRPYFDAYAEFAANVQTKWEWLEEPMVNRELWFAGTPDRIGLLNNYPTILELKTGYEAKWHPIQTAGQDVLKHGNAFARIRRFAVYLRKNGKYKLREHTGAGDYLTFMNALHSYRQLHPAIEVAVDETEDSWT